MNSIIYTGIIKNIVLMEDYINVAYLQDRSDGIYIFWDRKIFGNEKIIGKKVEVIGSLKLIKLKIPEKVNPIKIQAIQVKEMNVIEF